MSAHGPLSGVRVVEMASMLVGPYAAQMLADLGADVIKVEPPGGDIMRRIGPHRNEGMGAFFMGVNRNKRSVELDLKQPAGREAFIELIRNADVFLHSQRTVAAKKLQIMPDDLAEYNPRLVHCQIVGYSEQGRYAGRPAYDTVIQAASGIARLEALVVGTPAYTPYVIADKVGGLYAAFSVLAALRNRDATSQGSSIVVPMYETMVAFTMLEHQWGYMFDPPLADMGYKPVTSGARRPFATKDGHVSVLPYNDKHWRSFFATFGREELMDDPKFASFEARNQHYSDLWDEVEVLLSQHTNAELSVSLAEADVPFAIIPMLEELVDDPHLNDHGFWRRHAHESEGDLLFAAFPVEIDGENPGVRMSPPRLGEHNDEIIAKGRSTS